MAHAQTAEPQLAFTSRLFAAAPLPPVLVGIALAMLLLGLLLAIAWLSGDLAWLAARPEPWWLNRDARLGLLVPLLAAAAATATRYHGLGTRENLEAVARLGGWSTEEIHPERLPGSRFRERRAGLLGALFVPVLALLIDRDPAVYFLPGYWTASKIFTWVLGMLATTGGGILTYRALRDARHFSRLAARLPEVDLLEPERLSPFARQGLRSAVPGLLAITFIALNALDQGFLWAIGVMGGLGLVSVTAAFGIPLRGVRVRVQRAKREELARVHAAIQGDAHALQGSVIAARERPALSDLLAYRQAIASVHEWPIDFSTLGRVALYVAIPLASWIGAALVERAVDTALR